MSKLYKIRFEEQVLCDCGRRGQYLLTAGSAWLPAFYLCPACGDVAQVAEGHIGKMELDAPKKGRRG